MQRRGGGEWLPQPLATDAPTRQRRREQALDRDAELGVISHGSVQEGDRAGLLVRVHGREPGAGLVVDRAISLSSSSS